MDCICHVLLYFFGSNKLKKMFFMAFSNCLFDNNCYYIHSHFKLMVLRSLFIFKHSS